jgi:hypothetical protein
VTDFSVSITGLGDDDKVVMMLELSEEDLDEATGGLAVQKPICPYYSKDGGWPRYKQDYY